VTRGGVTLSDDCARTDETDAGDHALHDICVHDSVGTEHGYGGLHQAATRYGNKGEGAQTCALFLARSMPSDRHRKDECHQQMDEMVETVAPQAESARHQLLIRR
jgi:hypothetical protein